MTDKCAACGLDVYDGGQLCPICRADPPADFSANGANSPVESSTDAELTKLQQAARLAISEHGGVVAAARAFGCNHGIISLAAKGEDFPKARDVLGLPPKTVEVEPCPDCGKVHETKATCSHELQKARATKDYTVSFHLDDEELAVALRAIFDAHGRNRQEVARKIVNGDLVIQEVEQ